MDLYRLNLNLLVALKELLDAEHVSIAAERLNLSQSAMSNNLKQLRLLFGDPLLVRDKQGMLMTPFAHTLKPRLETVLGNVQRVVKLTPQFDPKVSERSFTVAISEFLIDLLFPKITGFFLKEAPYIQIKWLPRVFVGGLEAFEREEYELGIGWMPPHTKIDEKITQQSLWTKGPACIMSRSHPLAHKENITLEEYLQCEHVRFLSSEEGVPTLIDDALMPLGKVRKIRFLTESVGMMMDLVRQSHLLATSFYFFSSADQEKSDFVLKPLPFEVPPLDSFMCWHQHQNHDLGLMWLREALYQLLLDEYNYKV